MSDNGEPLLATGKTSNGWIKILTVYMPIGCCVVATYVWGVITLNDRFPLGNKANPDQYGAMNLWGHIQEIPILLNIYYCGFVIAVTGFFLNFGHILQVADKYMSPDIYKKTVFWYAIFMFSELFWMPCSVQYITAPSNAMWWFIFWQLKVSGISVTMWSYQQYKNAATAGTPSNNPERKGCPWVGFIGSTMIGAHCALLDGLIWSFLWNPDNRFPPPTGMDVNATLI
jgi:hypothetical protein